MLSRAPGRWRGGPSPVRPPTTVPFIRMNWRSGPSSSLRRCEVLSVPTADGARHELRDLAAKVSTGRVRRLRSVIDLDGQGERSLQMLPAERGVDRRHICRSAPRTAPLLRASFGHHVASARCQVVQGRGEAIAGSIAHPHSVELVHTQRNVVSPLVNPGPGQLRNGGRSPSAPT